MSWLIAGTVPYEDFPVVKGPCSFDGGKLYVANAQVPVARGAPALIAAATLASRVLETEPPTALLAGDIGNGRGSVKVYGNLVERLPQLFDSLMVFHYLQPDLDWHNRILLCLQELSQKPKLVADAGYMYVAKMSGFADFYDLFTPDIGELAFLADESAPHPFYTRGFLLQEEDTAEELITRAYQHDNAAQYLLVKGKRDLVASKEGIIHRICEPCVENMEPIGGTGDTVTGLAAALIQSGAPIAEAAGSAALVNRFMGLYSNPTPAYSVLDLLQKLEDALVEVLEQSAKEP
jgi:NAD(P)H-hydrate repair Nnr-like enzyme with NAD(P)H-hydrate dehydratase domain